MGTSARYLGGTLALTLTCAVAICEVTIFATTTLKTVSDRIKVEVEYISSVLARGLRDGHVCQVLRGNISLCDLQAAGGLGNQD